MLTCARKILNIDIAVPSQVVGDLYGQILRIPT